MGGNGVTEMRSFHGGVLGGRFKFLSLIEVVVIKLDQEAVDKVWVEQPVMDL